jgi:hypothetical protein
LLPKLVFAAALWLVCIGLILAAVSAPAVGAAFITEAVFGGTELAWLSAVAVVATFLATLLFVGDWLDLGM